ncbi:MAG: TetR/AcrR family transcriptional regulator [Gemmatimonadota bacterium]
MGRPKGYERDTVLDAAMELFWLKGFEATTTRELVDHLGLNRNSLYTEFGSKRGLYDAALRHYERRWLDRNLGPLERAEARLEDIEGLFHHYVSVARRTGTQKGCMMANSIVELAPVDVVAKQGAHRFLERARTAFQNALENGRAAGELRSSVDSRTEAAFFASTWLGMLVLLRAGSPAETLESVADRAVSYGRSLAA